MAKQNNTIAENKSGTSPVIGIVLMTVLTILLAGVTVSAVYSDDMFASLKKGPIASIEAVSVVGGLPGYPGYVKYEDNSIFLRHMGGDPLSVESKRIVISGKGSAYEGVVPHGTLHSGDILISYDYLDFDGKDPGYSSSNQVLLDGMWSAGEELMLNGQDGTSGASTVSVTINEITDTSNNYGLKENSWITIKIFDKDTRRIVSESECLVILYE